MAEEFKPQEWGVSEMEQKLIKIAVQLEIERKRDNITQAELAEKSGISQSQISRIERLQCVPSFETLYKIASALNLTLYVEIR